MQEALGGLVDESSDWVTKTDIIRCRRCPYGFWLRDQGLVTDEDLENPSRVRLLAAGSEHQAAIEADALPADTDLSLEEQLQGSALLLGEIPVENSELRIRGLPDGIDPRDGELLPVEIKLHKKPTATDRLELAFYWLALEPLRRAGAAKPRGVLLPMDGEAVEVRLTPRHFKEVHRLIAEVRRIRREGAEPRMCRCDVCDGPRREVVRKSVETRCDLTMIVGIGRRYAEALEAAGCDSYRTLINFDVTQVQHAIRECGIVVSVAEVLRWQAHARAYAEDRCVLIRELALPKELLLLDLEFDSGNAHTWLIGIRALVGARKDDKSFWADTPAEEREALRALGAFLRAYPGVPVITWNGRSADLPQLRKSADRAGDPELVPAILERHADLYRLFCDSVSIPIPGRSLGAVADFFGHQARDHPFAAGGFGAQIAYLEYLEARGDDRAMQREALIDYNRDDLDALEQILESVRSLQRSAPPLEAVRPS